MLLHKPTNQSWACGFLHDTMYLYKRFPVGSLDYDGNLDDQFLKPCLLSLIEFSLCFLSICWRFKGLNVNVA